MKPLYLIRLAIVIVIISHFSASAQDYRPGFVIKLSGDSIPGFIGYRSNEKVYEACLFKQNLQDAEIKYTTKEIIAYGFIDDKRYETKLLTTEGDAVFVECLVVGPISLYRYNNVFYVKKNNDSIVELPIPQRTMIKGLPGQDVKMKTDNKYIGLLNIMVYDCKINANKTKYAEVNLTYLIQKYNRCKGAPGLSYKNKKSAAHLNLQIFAGEDYSHIKVDGENADIYKFIYAPTGGIGLDISSPRINDKTFFSLEAWYVKKVYQGYDEQVTNFGNIKRDDYVSHASFLKIPFGFRYNFRKEDATPYFRVGIVKYININHSAELLTEVESGNTVSTYYNQYDLKFKNLTGFWLAVGYSRKIAAKTKGFIELRAERNRGGLGYMGYSVAPEATMFNVTVLAGIRF